ncbi:helix-turn-helix domain-containing protein [Photobacterium leiognathi]|uniref:helix-turn-helix domain-containing protein n=1 Tax=Photobacterium leiognathi TaxID=553611 RepID=UPI00298197CD|nr:helix-turn-helix domain-containing protein [Photobacterium leiognathi]
MNCLTSVNFHQLARREKNGQNRIRLLALAHVQDGKNRDDIAVSLKVSRSSINNWVRLYRQYGIEGILNKPRSGRPLMLTNEQQKTLIQYVDEQKAQKIWIKGYEVRNYIRASFNVEFELSYVYRLLKKLNITLRN